MNWREEVEILFEDFRKGFVAEPEMREQIEEWQDEIPEDDLEEAYVQMEQLIGEVEDLEYEAEISLAWQMYEGEDKEYVS